MARQKRPRFWRSDLSSRSTGPPQTAVPTHVAIILDGNGRWAQQRGLARSAGHRAGTENVRRVIRAMSDRSVQYVTLYAFSTENWRRPWLEVRGLFSILGEAIGRETEALHQEGVRIRHLGRLDRVNRLLRRRIERAVELTQNNTGLTLSMAFDYGGREELLQAVRRLLREGVDPDRLDEGLFASYLYTADLPDPDLIIRTAAEMRLSNFLLWQSAYSEYYSTSALWPDFDEGEVEKALQAYSQRQRRFGRVGAEAGDRHHD